MPTAAVAILGTVAGKCCRLVRTGPSFGYNSWRRRSLIYFGDAFLLMPSPHTVWPHPRLLSQTEGELKEMIQGVDPKKAAAARICPTQAGQ